jgi:hypothetical protein
MAREDVNYIETSEDIDRYRGLVIIFEFNNKKNYRSSLTFSTAGGRSSAMELIFSVTYWRGILV